MKPLTLHQLLRQSYRPLWKGLAYAKTAYSNVEQFIEIVGNLPLSKVDIDVMDEYFEAIDGTIAPATINRKLVNVHQVLKYAADRDWMEKVPAMPWQTEGEGRIRWLTVEEEVKVFALLHDWGEHEVAAFLRVLIETGLRRGELLRATEKDMDGNWLRIWVTKTKKARSVPLTPAAKEALEQFLPWTIDAYKLRQVWKRLRIEMKLVDDPHFVLHMLRHTAATRLLKKSKNLAIVQRLLGHRSIKTTTRYAHIDDQDLMDAVMA